MLSVTGRHLPKNEHIHALTSNVGGSPRISQTSFTPCAMFSSSTVSLIGILMYFSNTSLNLSPWSSSHSAAMFNIRRTPSSCSSPTCSCVVNSGPRYRKLGRMVEIVNTGKESSVVGGSSSSRAVCGDGGKKGLGVAGVCGGVK